MTCRERFNGRPSLSSGLRRSRSRPETHQGSRLVRRGGLTPHGTGDGHHPFDELGVRRLAALAVVIVADADANVAAERESQGAKRNWSVPYTSGIQSGANSEKSSRRRSR